MSDRLFIGVFPGGISYADRHREKDGDYARLAFLPYDTLQLEVEQDCPADLRARIVADAATIQSRRGESFQISSCSGQTVMLGSARRNCTLPHVDMIEVPGTSFDTIDPPGVAQFTALLAKKTAPVFQADASAPNRVFSEVVAVTYRGVDGTPVHGGLFGFGEDGVASLALKDLEGKIDTSQDPAFVALGLVMMRGALVFRQGGADHEMDTSIVDLHYDRVNEPLSTSSPAREAVRQAYLNEVLPSVNVVQPISACRPDPQRIRDRP